MKLRFYSLSALVFAGFTACGDDGETGGAGGTTGNTTGNTNSSSTKSASSGTSTSSASVSATGSNSASASTVTSSVSASSSASGQNLQLCGVDDPGGEEASCDPMTEYCEEMNGGIVASAQFECRPKPAACAGAPTCNCVDAQGCDCTMDGQMVRITCNFP